MAEGYNTIASGDDSHGEGRESTAGGEGSHAEGILTEASEFASHAEGSETLASGLVSHAEGSETLASGDGSHAEGSLTTASGTVSHAEGFSTTAAGDNSHAEGSETTAEGDGSHAEGCSTTASGTCSHAEGAQSTAEGDVSHGEGFLTTASGVVSHAEGNRTTASEFAAHAEGSSTIASGISSHAGGDETIAQGLAQMAIGRDNIASGNPFSSGPTDNAFIIGNGTTATRSNAFRVQFNGDVHSASGIYVSGADYAEMFEWQDGNPQNEDRRGYFVTLDGKYICKATAADQYILGIVSSTPSILGDSQSMAWQGMYLKDEWGKVIYEWVNEQREFTVIDPATHEKQAQTKTVRVQRPKLNPAYNPSLVYTPRTERSEWAAIGMMGKLRVRDDGTCKTNGSCRPNTEGIATASSQGYRVLERLDSNKVLILLDGPKAK
ncbi:peptidase G2 autoproteolytic cleavage domain-containing protein [Lacrimispora brassicae]